MKAPICQKTSCPKFMELKTAYMCNNGLIMTTYYVFQCNKCGKITEEEEKDLE